VKRFKNFYRSLSILLAIVGMICTFASCKSNPQQGDVSTPTVTTNAPDTSAPDTTIPQEESNPVSSDTAEPITEPSVTEPPATEPPVTEPPVTEPVISFVNPMTGLPTETDLSGQRPVSISIDNVRKAQPTIGLSYADVLVELPFEGFETRMLAIFLDYKELPTVGNIRSARDYMVRLSQDFDSIIVHAGSDTDVGARALALNAIRYGFPVSYLIKTDVIKYAAEREDIWTEGVDNIDGVEYFPNAMFRDNDRMFNMAIEHSTMINGEVICDCINYKDYRTDIKNNFTYPYTIGTEQSIPTDIKADHIKLPYNPWQTNYGTEYEFNSNTGEYLRSNYSSEPSIDGATGEQLSFRNVIVLMLPTSPFPNDVKNRLNVDYVGSGKGYYCCGGYAEEITWNRPDPDATLIITGKDGNKLDIAPGKVIINVYPTEYVSNIKLADN